MTTAAEFHNLGEAASTALRLHQLVEKNQNGEDDLSIRHIYDMPIMVAIVSNRPPDHPDEWVTTPVAYNHPVLTLEPRELSSIAQLPSLADANPLLPSLHRTVNLYHYRYADPDNGLPMITLLHHNYSEFVEQLADDVTTGQGVAVDALFLAKRVTVNPRFLVSSKIDDKYWELRRGRSTYRENSSPFDSDRPVAERAHRRSHLHRRTHSLPSNYDKKLESYDHDPLQHLCLEDDDQHKAALIEEFRQTSEQHLLYPSSSELRMKKPGIGEGEFSYRDVYREAYKFAYQRRDCKEHNGRDVDILVKGNAKMIRDFLKHFNQPVQSSSILGPNTASCRLVRPWVCLTLTVRSLRRTMCVSLFSGK